MARLREFFHQARAASACIAVLLCALVPLISHTQHRPATTTVLGPGQTLTLTSDFLLTGTDVLEMDGTPDQPCTIEGNNFQVLVSGAWSGQLKLNYVRIHNLGTSQYPPDGNTALSAHHAFWLPITAGGSGSFTNCVFDASSSVYVYTDYTVPFTFNNNTILDNSLVPARAASPESFPCFIGEGPSQAPKLFQGNHIYKAYISFNNTPGWLIGGATDAESNILIGQRAGIGMDGYCPNMTVRGNYVHHIYPTNAPNPNQTTSAVLCANSDLVVMDNIFRDGARVVKSGGGVFARNVVLDAGGEFWLVSPHTDQKIHHNIFAQYHHNLASVGILHVEPDSGVQVYNNVLDGGGVQADFGGPAVQVSEQCFLASLRNNVFYNFTHLPGYASVDNGNNGFHDTGPLGRLNYADYNLFSNPQAATPTNYGLTVPNLRLRLDPGFALNDALPHGAVNQQVAPMFAGPVPTQFPFDDAAIKSGAVPVSQILAAYRSAYAPAPNSPLVDAGDPQDGAGTDIGAVERGAYPSTSDTTPPPAPANLGANVGTDVVLTWSPGSAVDLAQYRVYLSLSPAGPFTQANATINVQAVPPSATVKDLQTGVKYYFSVTAVDTSGNESAGSNVVSATQTTPRFTISGTVTAGGTPIAGATVSAGGNSVVSGADGSFTITSLLAGNYQVTATKAEYTFTAVPVTVGPNAQGVSVTGTRNTYTISGTVTVNGVGLAGATVTAGSQTTATAADGTFTLSGFFAGSYQLSVSKTEFLFGAPQTVTVGPSRAVMVVGTPVLYPISGTVTANGAPLAGVTVTSEGQTAITAADGTYTLPGLPAGTHTVTPSKIGYGFTPASKSVKVGPAQTGVNFTAAAVPILTDITPATATVKGGKPITLTVTVSMPLAKAGAVPVTSGGSAVVAPTAGAKIKARGSSGKVTLKTKKVTGPMQVPVTASFGGVQKTAVITVTK